MEFEVFTGKSAPISKEPMVTIQKTGAFSLNRLAHEAFGRPRSVELMYDRAKRVVAMRPSNKQHSYAVRAQSKRAGTRMQVSGAAFTKHFGIDTTASRRYVPQYEDGMLLLDLNDPR